MWQRVGRVMAGLWLLSTVWSLPLPVQSQPENPVAGPQQGIQTRGEAASDKVTWQFVVQSGSAPTDMCGALAEARRQQLMVLFAYQNTQVLQAAMDSGLNWQGYSTAVENLVRTVYTVGGIEHFDFARDVGPVETLLEPLALSFDPGEVQIVTVLETHSNGTIWGFDHKGNRVLLVDRSGMIHESSQELVIQAHKDHFGEQAGEWLYYAHLDHELTHRHQLLSHAEGYMPSLEEYQHNEIEAYEHSIQSKEQALKSNGCF